MQPPPPSPATSDQDSSGEESFSQPLVRLRRRRLLVVEDDLDLWKMVERIARAVDPEVIIDFARNADEAIDRMLERHRYDLILADFMLADSRSGFWLQQRCERLQPWSNFALMSALPLRTPGPISCPFLHKPFTIPECRDFLAQLLL
jgi:DNA-binding NtrC family response regulator